MHDENQRHLGKLALATACVSLKSKQCKSAQLGQPMDDLSPTARAVLSAAMQYEINPECYSRKIAVTVLKTLSEHCLHETPKGCRYMLASELRQLISQLNHAKP